MAPYPAEIDPKDGGKRLPDGHVRIDRGVRILTATGCLDALKMCEGDVPMKDA
jgi:hypothetical protein